MRLFRVPRRDSPTNENALEGLSISEPSEADTILPTGGAFTLVPAHAESAEQTLPISRSSCSQEAAAVARIKMELLNIKDPNGDLERSIHGGTVFAFLEKTNKI